MGVQFKPLGLTTPHLGLLWKSYRSEDLLQVEEHPPLEHSIERFGVVKRPYDVFLKISRRELTNRVWFHNETGSELIQVQADRFIFNWRKVHEQDCYPRYGHVEEKFFKALETFRNFLIEHRIGETEFTQCEVTYVNHIFPVEGVWSYHGQAGRAVTLISSNSHDFLPDPEDVRAVARFLILGPHDEKLGRLHIKLEPRFSTENLPLLHLQLMARGAPLGEDLNGVRSFFRLGREWIVKGFLDVTSPAMHNVWGRR